MHKHITAISLLLLAEIITITIIMIATSRISNSNSNQLAYAHNFVPAQAASFLTRINQIKVESQLVESNLPLNLSLAKQHAKIATELFDNNTQRDLYYNAEGNNGLAKRVSDDISLALSNLQKAVATTTTTTTTSKQLQPQQQAYGPVIKPIKEIVNKINDILDKAVSVRIDNYDLTNSTVDALVLADITEKAYNDYSYAFGIKPVIFSGSPSMMNMMGMGMMSPNASSSSDSSSSNSTTKSHSTTINNTLVNATAYQHAQGLAVKAQDIFNNVLKPISSATNATSSANTISKIENNLIHLKNAIDSKAPVMDIMKIVHGDIHPTLLTAYNLQLKR